jgi:hypothetical protein
VLGSGQYQLIIPVFEAITIPSDILTPQATMRVEEMLNFLCTHHQRKRHIQRLKMFFTAAHLSCFAFP